MALKLEIVEELGEDGLLLPERIGEALTANDQVKYYFALLQMARANADRPSLPVQDLKTERLASRIEDTALDEVVATAKRVGEDRYAIPQTRTILAAISAGIDTMLACLPEPQRAALADRARELKPPLLEDDTVEGALIDRMTSGEREHGDSLHLVVMDAHKAINALQAETAVETLAGARVHNLSPRARGLVEAFMNGLNRTAPLKFDHPGLGTTATEHEGRILIQNDIGTTDAHVLVVRIDASTASLTYTDIHRQRLGFFKSLFEDWDVDWTDVDTRRSGRLENASYLLTTGSYRAGDEAELARYLDHLGSRIVFLIDWNKARKRLRNFVSNERAVEVLHWAAAHDFGHRGLLEVGGEKALAEAVEFAAGERLHYGDRLDTLIEEESAAAFLRNACELASAGLRQQRSRRVIADEIKADLRRHFEKTQLAIFAIAGRHAACGYDLAVSLSELLDDPESGGAAYKRFAQRASIWEGRADILLNEARDDIRRFDRPAVLMQFFERSDDAVDQLEEAASLMELATLVHPVGEPLKQLRLLSETVLAAAQELIKCIECAATITRSDVRDDLDDFLKSFDQLVALEHRGDDLIREIRRVFLADGSDARMIYLVDHIARALEASTDAYAHAAQHLRSYLMEEVLS
ncbi:DUF47 family protein [Methyloligella sp. 2.7D]|uniref:DUF47 family protein n=1 Tax=unclassified Methyloligella TaxID=2625955 RepID=UPI00157D32E9|nr:DUF47 family protein [Methyloligella sp. GL2]QKP78151.1 DUF47 family protein [Methyloligella sp. GL2]